MKCQKYEQSEGAYNKSNIPVIPVKSTAQILVTASPGVDPGFFKGVDATVLGVLGSLGHAPEIIQFILSSNATKYNHVR